MVLRYSGTRYFIDPVSIGRAHSLSCIQPFHRFHGIKYRITVAVITPVIIEETDALLDFTKFIVVCIRLPDGTSILIGIQQVGFINPFRELYTTFVTNLRFTLFTLLCFDDNHTTGSSRTINTGRSRIFQYLNRFNIRRVDITQVIVSCQSVKYDQRVRLRIQ